MLKATGKLLGVMAAAAMVLALRPAPLDLDVDVPLGNPLDSIKLPLGTPTDAGKPKGTATAKLKERSAGNGAARATVAEDPRKVPPPPTPLNLPGIKQPSTPDYENHLKWRPKNILLEYDPGRPDIATGIKGGEEPVEWKFDEYPPAVPNDLYVYGIARFLMVMLHSGTVSENEMTQFLVELGYPGHYAATATVGEARLAKMAKYVMDAVGGVTKVPPRKPRTALEQKIYMDLIGRYPYEPDFGAFIMTLPSEKSMPILLNIIEKKRHPQLVRNAVFLLRVYNVPDVVPPVRSLLMKTRDKVIRNRCLAVLVRWQDRKITKWLVKQLFGPDESFRSAVLWALGRIGDPSAIDPVIKFVKMNKTNREVLWAAIPALCRMGEMAFGKEQDRVENFLDSLKALVASIQDPPAWDESKGGKVIKPDPPKPTEKVLSQRILLSLARLGRAAERDQVKSMTEADFVRPNILFYRETKKKLP